MKSIKCLTALSAIAISLTTALSLASPAATARTRPSPSPAPAPAVVTSVIVNEANQGTFRVTNPDELGVDYVVQIFGPPIIPVPPFPGRPENGYVVAGEGRLTGLIPSSNYAVTVYRHRFYDARTNQAVNVLSVPTSFSFTTPSLAATRPSAPSIRIAGQTATHVELAWAPSTDNVSSETELQYTYAVAGDPSRAAVPTCFQYCFGATGTSIARPAPGTSISVMVTAIDKAGLLSLPSNAVTITG